MVDHLDTRIDSFNTPKKKNVRRLFSSCVGIAKVPDAWRWTGCSAATAGKRLDRFVELRGAIAHGRLTESVREKEVRDNQSLVDRLVEITDDYVGDKVEALCGQPLF